MPQAIISHHMKTNNQGQKWDDSLETFLAALQEGIIVLDASQEIVHINPVGRKIFALGDSSFLGRPLADVFKQPELSNLIALLDDPLHQNAQVNIAVGEDSLYSAAATRLDSGGSVITLHDVSQWNRLDRIRSAFISTISHDIRSPLTSIMGYADLIDRVGPLSDQQRSFVQRIQANTANIVRFLEDLIRLDQIEVGRDASRERVNLPAITDEVIKNFSNRIEEKDIHIEVDFADSMPTVLANRHQMVQVFSCLLENAIKFSSPKSTIRVIGKIAEQQAIVEISDTGIGIPDLEIEHIFKRFFRGSNIPEAEPGNGLGLTIVKTVLDYLEGRIWVDSSLDSGTRVTFVLPASNLPEEELH